MHKFLSEPTSLIVLKRGADLFESDGEPFWHIHGTFGRRDFSVVGGHITQCSIDPLAEIAITPINAQITREFDEQTRLMVACPIDSKN